MCIEKSIYTPIGTICGGVERRYISTSKTKTPTPKTHIAIEVIQPLDTATVTMAKQYCDRVGFRTDFAILMDLSTHSGNYRFFGINLETKDTLIKALVAHGHCKVTDHRLPYFSNEKESNCSSLGKYRIGKKYNGAYGTSYKLHGLENTNSNAFDRFVVLHSDLCVPDVAQADDICQSEGCPTVSPNVLQQLIPLLDVSNKPVLLWIYD